MTIFNENSYDFMDSSLVKIEIDNAGDYLLVIDLFQGENIAKYIILRLHNVVTFSFKPLYVSKQDKFSPLEIAYISKKYINGMVRLKLLPSLSLLPAFKKYKYMISCVCEEVFIEDDDV